MNTSLTTQFNEYLNHTCPGLYMIDGKQVEFSVLAMELGSWDDLFESWLRYNQR